MNKANKPMHYLRTSALTAALLASLAAAPAHAWEPTRPVDVVVHTGPGGGNDLLGRAIVTMMQTEKLLPVRMQILNKTGGNGAVAAAYVAGKNKDSYTLALINSVWIANALTTEEAQVTVHDLKPVAQLVRDPAVIAVRADSPYKTLHDFIEDVRAKPSQLKQSGGSITSRDNIVRLSLQSHTHTKWNFVSFPGGGERLSALLGGHVDMMVIEPQEAGEQVRAGKLRLLARLSNDPLPGVGYENVPTLQEAGYDVTPTPQIRALMAPPDMPDEVVAYWADRFQKLQETDSWKKYVRTNQLENDYADAASLKAIITSVEGSMREQYTLAGIKVVRP